MTTGMEYFLVLAEEQSISRAAQRLYVSQQSMSEQMKRLEASCGAKLFTRRPKFGLTPAGEALLGTLRQIRVLEQGLDVQLRDIQEKGGGKLRVGVHATRARIFLPRAVQRFHQEFPQVELTFFHDDTQGFERMLLNGELDLFFGVDTHQLPEFEYLPLAEEPIYLVASEGLLRRQLGWEYPKAHESLSAEELRELDLIFSHSRSNMQQAVDAFLRAQAVIPRKVVTISDFEVQMMLARCDIGACFCPRLMLQKVGELNTLNPGIPCASIRFRDWTAPPSSPWCSTAGPTAPPL